MCTDEEKKAALLANNLDQITESQSDDNRHFAGEHFGRPVDDLTELFDYYVDHGGAKGHRERVEARRAAEAEKASKGEAH